MWELPSLQQSAESVGAPVSASIELISACNLHCVHCYVNRKKSSKLDLETLTALFDELETMRVFALTFTGGEIGLRPDLFDILKEARKRHFALHLLTNGTLWQDDEWQSLAELGVNSVRISIYAESSSVHDSITGVVGSLERSMATLKGLIAHDVPVGISAPVMKQNVSQIPALIEVAKSLNVGISVDSALILTESGGTEPKKALAQQERLEKMWRDPRLKPIRRRLEEFDCAVGEDGRPCAVGNRGFFINSVGDVFPCPPWPESAGNIHSDSLNEIWTESSTFKLARSVNFGVLKKCHCCEFLQQCSPCPAMNLHERGNVALPSETVCQAARVIELSEPSFDEDS